MATEIYDLLPFLVGGTSVASGSTTVTVTPGTLGGTANSDGTTGYPTADGEAIFLICTNAGVALPSTAPTDSKSNVYVLLSGASVNALAPGIAVYAALNENQPSGHVKGLNDAQSITVTWASTSNGKGVLACAASRTHLTAAYDVSVTAAAQDTTATASVASAASVPAGELLLACLSNVNGGGSPSWSSAWSPVGTTHAAAQYTSVAWQQPGAAGTKTPSATVNAGNAWSMVLIGIKPKPSSVYGLAGVTITPGCYNKPRDQSADIFDGFLGRPFGYNAEKVYTKGSASPYNQELIATDIHNYGLDVLNSMGSRVYLCLAPGLTDGGDAPSGGPVMNGANKTILGQICYRMRNKNFVDWRAVFRQECNLSHFASASDYITWHRYYTPTIQAAGIWVCYDPAIASGGAGSNASVNNFYPGRAYVNELGIDYYMAASEPGYKASSDSSPLDLTTAKALAESEGLPLSILETGLAAHPSQMPVDPASGNPGFLTLWNMTGGQGIVQCFARRRSNGHANETVMWYTAAAHRDLPNSLGSNAIDGDTPQDEIDALVAFYDAFQGPATGVNPVITNGGTLATDPQVGTSYNPFYTFAIKAGTGTAPFTFSVSSGAPPAGMHVGTAGNLYGTPTAAGSTTFTVMVTDNAGLTGTASVTVTVDPVALAVPAQTLPVFTEGTAGAAALTAVNGTPPDTWTLLSGSLPTGLTLHSDGTITGTPAAGTHTSSPYSFTPQVTDHAGATASRALSLTVNAPVSSLTITTPSNLTPGTVGDFEAIEIDEAGGTGPVFTWSVISGSVPDGMTLQPSEGDPGVQDEAGATITDEAGSAITNG